MTESQLQRAVAKVLDYSGLLWCHVPNGGKRSIITASIMKAEGVKRGVPDILIFDRGTVGNGTSEGFGRPLAIELKVGKNKPGPEQVQWHAELTKRKWRVEVCYTLDAVMEVLRDTYPSKFP